MDPEACLNDAQSLLTDGCYYTARTSLSWYRSWRNHGGFAPPGGDSRHMWLLQLNGWAIYAQQLRIRNARRSRHAALV